MSKTKTFVGAVAIGLIVTLILSFTGFASECEGLRKNTIRLHIIANSDSEEDQAVKLEIRDLLLSKFKEIFALSANKNEALKASRESLAELENAASEILAMHGLAYTARAEICKMYFDVTDYGDSVMPSGRYDAVRIILGSGKGKNWFCIAFPPLCIQAAEEKSDKSASSDASSKQTSSAKAAGVPKKKGGYTIKFKVYETLKKLFK